jgi:hypothetical protein
MADIDGGKAKELLCPDPTVWGKFWPDFLRRGLAPVRGVWYSI